MSTAFNVVKFRARRGLETDLVEAHREARTNFRGFRRGWLVNTGKRDFVFIGEWTSYASLAAARPKMTAMLDTFRDTLDDLGDGLGVTEPVSGEVVVELEPKQAATRKKRPAAGPRKRHAAAPVHARSASTRGRPARHGRHA